MSNTITRRNFIEAMGASAAAAFLAGCGSTSGDAASSDGGSGDETEEISVCFVEVVENDAFVAMQQGFKDEIETKLSNVSYEVKNAQGDTSTLNQIAADLKTANYSVIVPIATPAAQAVVNAGLDTPVVFISVANPVASGLMDDLDEPNKGATGTSNNLAVDEIMTFAEQLVPEIAEKTVGLLYCSGETNAVATIDKMKSYLDDEGIAYTEQSVASSADCQQAAKTLAADCGCIYVPVDSVVQSAMAQVVEAATAAKIPVLGSDPVMVKSGALCSVAVTSETIGSHSADIAAQVVTGTDVADIPVDVVTEYEKDVSKSTAEALGVEIPEDDDIVVMD